MAFADALKNRKKTIDEATEEPKIVKSSPEPEVEKKAAPITKKTFSDGTEREWDEQSQSWVVLHPAGFQKAIGK